MKRDVVDLSEERKIVTNLIIDDTFLASLYPVIRADLFASTYAQTVVGWIIEYYAEYRSAPGKMIQEIYLQRAATIRDEEDAEVIAEYLRRLSKGSEKISNHEYLIKRAVHWLKLRALERVKAELDIAIRDGNPVAGENAISGFSRIEKLEGTGVALLQDASGVRAAFDTEEEELFRFPGVLGEVVGTFVRGDLVSYLAFTNKGKSFWLWYIAQEAMTHGLSVLFVTLEMQERQMVRRAWISVTGRPRKTMDIEFCEFEADDDGGWIIQKKTEKRRGLQLSHVEEEQKKLRFLRRGADARIVSFPAYSASVDDIIGLMDNMEFYDGFRPDVLCIDYADIIKPVGRYSEHRHQLDDIWKRLRGLAQTRNILVATVSQSGRSGATKDVDDDDVAEDIRKLAHVSKMITINQHKGEYEYGLFRINQIKEREGRRSFRTAAVLSCLDIGRPCIDSRYLDEVTNAPEQRKKR